MHRVLLAGMLMLMMAAPAMAEEACGGDGVAVFPGLGGDADIFGLAPEPEPLAAAKEEEEDCGEAIQMDVEPRPGMLVALTSPPKAEALVCSVTSEVIETYRARHGEVDYMLAPEAAPATGDAAAGEAASLRVAHVITDDPDYVSPEGLRVGDTLERALALAGGDVAFTTGGLCLALPSGWAACFDPEGSGVTPGGVFTPSPGTPIRDFHLM